MKTQIFILFFLPMITFSQTADDYFRLAYNSTDNQEKIDNYTRCLKIEPYNTVAYYNRARIYQKLGNYKDAITDFTSAIRVDPDYAIAYNDRGIIYANLENYEEAIADFTRAIRISPDYANAYLNRGIAKEAQGLYYCKDYKKACVLGDKESCEWYSDKCE